MSGLQENGEVITDKCKVCTCTGGEMVCEDSKNCLLSASDFKTCEFDSVTYTHGQTWSRVSGLS